jgi:hypothetical protein
MILSAIAADLQTRRASLDRADDLRSLMVIVKLKPGGRSVRSVIVSMEQERLVENGGTERPT